MDIEELKQDNNNNSSNIPIEYNEFYESVQSDYDTAQENEDSNPSLSLKLYEKILSLDDPKNIIAKIKEDTIYSIGKLYIKNKQFNEFKELFIKIRPFFNNIPKARTAKIVRALIDMVGDDPSGLSIQSSICLDAIDWCKQSKRSFLKQRIQSKLAALYYKQKKYNDGLSLIQSLIREVRKFDDKLLMLEIYLIESKIFFSLENYQKSKASLTAARSSANAIYCPPAIQAEIDLMAGILCAKESDWKTAFSYFFESFEGFQTVKDDKAALQALKYMILSKILLNSYDDVSALISGKAGIKYSGPELLAMKAVADAYKQRSIELFEDVYNNKYSKELKNDSTISDHLSELKETLLEQNLQKLIEPFTRVQITHLALLIKLPKELIENKLSEMILDKKLNGILDQGAGDLILFHNTPTDQSYQSAIDTCKELSNVIDRLYAKAKRLTA